MELDEEVSPQQILEGLSQTVGDISDTMTEDQLTLLGQEVVTDYEADLADREPWERVVKEALKSASQEAVSKAKTYPWNNASNVKYPLLTIAGLQFNARAYPSIVKGMEAVKCKVVGADEGIPAMQPTPDGNVVPLVNPETGQPVWQRPPGAKASRAKRVKDYMNTVLFFRMDDWEEDTDMLLMQLPIVGCAFRKIAHQEGKHSADLVSALNLVVPMTAKSCKTAPRLTEIISDQYPYEILEKMRSGFYRPAQFIEGEEFDKHPRTLLEQHRRIDIDGDGYPEPYIVTVDHESTEVLRVVANYDIDAIEQNEKGVVKIEPRNYYVKYGFFPHPDGKFYDIGLGHLLHQIGGVIDTSINQLADSATAATAGGGFIGAGVRLQGSSRTSTIKMTPGEWKTVNVSGDQLRNSMVERTLPEPSTVTFQLLELMLGAAKEISSITDVMTGDASNNGQVGTTLALIDQGMQVFTAIYKRVYRSLKKEFELIFENIAKHASEETIRDYLETLDDPDADFFKDFNQKNMDIQPVSDPTSVTRMQQMARAQFLGQYLGAPGINNEEIYKRMFEAADVEDVEELIVPQQPPQPNPKDIASAQKDMASAGKEVAQAENIQMDTMSKQQEFEIRRLEALATSFQQGFGG